MGGEEPNGTPPRNEFCPGLWECEHSRFQFLFGSSDWDRIRSGRSPDDRSDPSENPIFSEPWNIPFQEPVPETSLLRCEDRREKRLPDSGEFPPTKTFFPSSSFPPAQKSFG
ncbi:hypothetical protein ABH19_06835 [Leptospirillum sp. Group II 'CF-1']|nr:hypothetical protein ABH19_06835 [Leptospirillum sp. Group II 'CF-1']